MDQIEKALRRLNDKERQKVIIILNKLIEGNVSGLNIKKLKGRDNIFRARVGDLRIIYRTDPKDRVVVLSISRRNENTYK